MRSLCLSTVVAVVSVANVWFVPPQVSAQSQTTSQAHAIAGAWTLNKDLTQKPEEQSGGDQGDRRGRPDGGGTRGFGGRRGGSGGGGYGGGGRQGGSPEERQRMRDAMRDIMSPAERLTITEADSMIIITSGDGRTERLMPNGKSITDESTKISRKTKWDGDKLVCEIGGAGPRRITKTYAVDPDHKQLRVTVQVDRPNRPMTVSHVYDAGVS